MSPVRKTLIVGMAALTAVVGPVAVADARPKKCTPVQREFFPWECHW